mmetsp:Transcript_17415/g.36517  ORF Transcript_17415/g.36517 Transcript_17415/m.36517 type:complete len:108 (-) Transcript_17415:982-1305(-)
MRAVFPALRALRYCYANILAMDKKYYLVKTVDYALLSSQTILNDKSLFESMMGALCNGVSKEMSAVFQISEDEDYLSDDNSSVDYFDEGKSVSFCQAIQEEQWKRKS